MRLGAAFWGGIWYFQRYFPSSLPFLWILFVLLALPLGLWGGFCPLMGPYGGTVCHVGSVQLLERQPSPQQPARFTGLFAKQQRNCHPAELLTRPEEAQWGLGVMQVPEREARGLDDPHKLIFHPKSPFLLGQRPCEVWPSDPSTTGPRGIFPISTCFGKFAGMKTPPASGILQQPIQDWKHFSPPDPTWREKYLSDGSGKQRAKREQGNREENLCACKHRLVRPVSHCHCLNWDAVS